MKEITQDIEEVVHVMRSCKGNARQIGGIVNTSFWTIPATLNRKKSSVLSFSYKSALNSVRSPVIQFSPRFRKSRQ